LPETCAIIYFSTNYNQDILGYFVIFWQYSGNIQAIFREKVCNFFTAVVIYFGVLLNISRFPEIKNIPNRKLKYSKPEIENIPNRKLKYSKPEIKIFQTEY
jgi:hypothetical protein